MEKRYINRGIKGQKIGPGRRQMGCSVRSQGTNRVASSKGIPSILAVNLFCWTRRLLETSGRLRKAAAGKLKNLGARKGATSCFGGT